MRPEVAGEDVPDALGQGVRRHGFQWERSAPHWLIGGNSGAVVVAPFVFLVDRQRCGDSWVSMSALPTAAFRTLVLILVIARSSTRSQRAIVHGPAQHGVADRVK